MWMRTESAIQPHVGPHAIPKIREGEEGTIDPILKTLSFWKWRYSLLWPSRLTATHPMSYYGQRGVSADFVGMARKLRQA